MKIHFSGVGEAREIDFIAEHPTCPRIGETVSVPVGKDETDEWSVRHISHVLDKGSDYDVYCVIGPPPR